jgi:hypothetical protein
MFEARVKVIPHKFQPDENQTGSQYHFQPRLRCGKIVGQQSDSFAILL